MPVRATSGTLPGWDDLFAQAQAQAGYFTTREAAAHHIGTALLTHHVKSGRVEHVGRGVFRFARFPPTPREELVPLWLWSEREGLFSHETALSLYSLSDLAPTHVDMTLPSSRAKRRLKAPSPNLVMHFADVPPAERGSWGPVPCTSLIRTLNDCAAAGTESQYLAQAVRQALKAGQLLKTDRSQLVPELRRLVPPVSARKVR